MRVLGLAGHRRRKFASSTLRGRSLTCTLTEQSEGMLSVTCQSPALHEEEEGSLDSMSTDSTDSEDFGVMLQGVKGLSSTCKEPSKPDSFTCSKTVDV